MQDRLTKRVYAAALSLAALSLVLSGCAGSSPPPTLDRSLEGYLFAPALEIPSTDDAGNVRVDAVYQDVQRMIDPESDVVLGDRAGWVVVAICAPEAEQGDVVTELQAALIPEDLLSTEVRSRAESGEFLGELDCGDNWTRAPD